MWHIYQLFLRAARPGSSVFQVAHSRHLSPPQMERGEVEESLQGNSLPLAGGFWHWRNHTPTGAGCSTCNNKPSLNSLLWQIAFHLLKWAWHWWFFLIRGKPLEKHYLVKGVLIRVLVRKKSKTGSAKHYEETGCYHAREQNSDSNRRGTVENNASLGCVIKNTCKWWRNKTLGQLTLLPVEVLFVHVGSVNNLMCNGLICLLVCATNGHRLVPRNLATKSPNRQGRAWDLEGVGHFWSSDLPSSLT